MTFPRSPLPTKVELQLGQTWTDITDWVRPAPSIRHGRADEGGRADPARLTLTLDNRDGRFSSRNPTGPYYGLIGRNTPIRVSLPADSTYLAMPGGDDNSGIGCPDASALDITGDIDIRLEAELHHWWTSPATLAGKAGLSGQISWYLAVVEGGFLRLGWSPDGSNFLRATSTVKPPSVGRHAIRATLDVNNGASGNTVTFYTSNSISGSWTQLGDPVVTAGTTSIFSGTGTLEVGDSTGLGGDGVLGRAYAFELRDGIGGAVVANPDFTAQAAGAGSFADSASSPNTWTIQGRASLEDRLYRFLGEVSAWPQRWSISETDSWAEVQAAGILRRLGQGAAPLDSTMRRALTGPGLDSPPVAYWPCEDAAGSTRIASGLPGGQPITINIELPGFAADSSFECSRPITTVQNSSWYGAVSPYTPSLEAQMRFLMHVDAVAANNQRIATMYCSGGSISAFRLFYGTGGTLNIASYDANGALIAETGHATIAGGVDGRRCRISVEATQDGDDVDFGVVKLDVGASSGGSSAATATGHTFGQIAGIGINAGGGLASGANKVGIGHISVHRIKSSIFDLAAELTAYAGEAAGERVVRLCDEEGIGCQIIGSPGSTELMGAQLPATLVTLLAECADVDGGMLCEPRDMLGIGYRTRVSLYSQTQRLEIDHDAYELSASLEPTEDDQSARNDVTVSRPGGSSGRAALESGPMSVQVPPDGIGRYDESVTLNAQSDDRLPDLASWRVHLGTVDEARFPVVELSRGHRPILENPALDTALLAFQLGDRLTITNPPAGLPPDDISQIVQGYTETLGQWRHTLQLNCTPESPWRVASTDDDTLGRFDTDGSQLAGDVSDSATSITVAVTDGPLWTIDSAEMPFDVVVGGEVMTVTEVAGADGSFESGVSDWTGVSCTLAQTTTQRLLGGHACLMTVTGSPTQAFFRPTAGERALVQVGGSYTATMWGYSTAGRANNVAAIDWFDSGGNYLATDVGTTTALPAATWTYLSVTAAAPAGAAYAAYGPTLAGSPAAGTVTYWDAVDLATASAQVFTVTRSSNGVVKSHSAGADVRLTQPAITAL